LDYEKRNKLRSSFNISKYKNQHNIGDSSGQKPLNVKGCPKSFKFYTIKQSSEFSIFENIFLLSVLSKVARNK